MKPTDHFRDLAVCSDAIDRIDQMLALDAVSLTDIRMHGQRGKESVELQLFAGKPSERTAETSGFSTFLHRESQRVVRSYLQDLRAKLAIWRSDAMENAQRALKPAVAISLPDPIEHSAGCNDRLHGSQGPGCYDPNYRLGNTD